MATINKSAKRTGSATRRSTQGGQVRPEVGAVTSWRPSKRAKAKAVKESKETKK